MMCRVQVPYTIKLKSRYHPLVAILLGQFEKPVALICYIGTDYTDFTVFNIRLILNRSREIRVIRA